MRRRTRGPALTRAMRTHARRREQFCSAHELCSAKYERGTAARPCRSPPGRSSRRARPDRKALTMRPNPSAGGPVTPRRRAAALAAVLLLAGSPAVAQPAAAGTEPADRAAEIDAIFSWAAPDAPGCAVAVAREGKVVLERTHGLADLERGTPIGPDTLFDAGSVVKQFVAAAVLLLVDEGRLSLDDDIRAHLPELPDYGHKVTIDHLLTHTS